MRRYIESALRLRIRIILAALLIFGAAVGALSFTKGGFTSSATVWVEKPASNIAGFTDPSTLNQYISAATFVNNILQQYLVTEAFKLTIAQKAGIPIHTDVDLGRVLNDLQRNLHTDTVGPNLIKISYTGDKPVYCQEIISQTIATLVFYQNTSRLGQTNITLGVYQNQLSDAEGQVNKSKQALTKYIQDHPGQGGLGTVPDPTYTDLQQQYTNDLNTVSSLKDKIDQQKTQLVVPTEVNTNFLRVIDAPDKPLAYKPGVKDILRNVGLALALALIAAVGLTLVGTWTDAAIYTLNDVSSLALADAEGNARELLVGIVPYVPVLGAARRREAKQSKSRKAQQPVAGNAGRSAPTVAAPTTRR